MIVNIPIEPVRGRYSEDWSKWFSDELTNRKFDFTTISGPPLRTEIKDGAFLDVIATTHYKSHQIEQICMAVDSGFIPRNERVVFLLHDGWFPIEQLAYLRSMLDCNYWKFVGLFHAGTYDRWDQTAQHGMASWGEDLENSWFKIYDKIIVASDYHMNLILENRRVQQSKFAVIPWKVEVPNNLVDDLKTQKLTKENWVIFPHRHNPEKLDGMFKEISVSPYYWIDPNSISETKEAAIIDGRLKQRYYELLAKSKICVSFSLQETFGIAMVEAVLLGCIPLVPDRLSYKEMYPRVFRYKGESEFKEKLEQFCQVVTPPLVDLVQYELRELQDKFKSNSSSFFPNLFNVLEEL